MSSISSSDRARHTDELRQAREEAESNEIETAKRTKAEKRRLQENHEAELNRIKDQYENQISTLRNKHKDTITSRDQENQNQINKVKDMYMEQVRRKTEETDTLRKSQKAAYDAELERLDTVSGQQKEILTRRFRDSLADRDVQFDEYQTKTQEMMQNAIADRSDRLSEKFEKERDLITRDRDEKVGRLSLDKDELKTNLEKRIRDQDRKNRTDTDRRDGHWREALTAQDKMNAENLTSRDELLQANRASMQSRYDKALQQKLADLDSAHEGLRNQVEERLDGQVRSLSHELSRSKTDRTVDMITNRRIRDLEKKHLVEAQQERMEGLEHERREIINNANEITHGRIGNIIQKTETVIQDTNRRNKMQQNISNQQNREARQQLEFEMRNRLEHANDQTDKRLRRLMGTTNEQMAEQQKYHDENLTQIKANYSGNLAVQREAQLETLQSVRMRAEERVREQDAKAVKKLDDTISNYEAKIAKIEEENKAEKARMANMYEQRMANREKAFKIEQESQAQKYETKLATSDELRQKEIERVERRNQENMANMASRMKYLNKKA